MTLEIPKSQVADPDKFAESVNAYVDELHAFNKKVGVPRPTSHPLVEAAIRQIKKPNQADTYVADYVIFDDGPPMQEQTEPMLEDKKNMLGQTLYELCRQAKSAVLSERKYPLLGVKYNMAMQKIKYVDGKEVSDDRTDQEKLDCATLLACQKRWQELDLIYAQALSDLDDMTDANIDKWQPPNFG
jgi:hypothetical protein